MLPHDTLTQLALGLSGLIASSRFVLQYEYRLGKSNHILGAITPIGGVAFLAAWVLVAWSAYKGMN